MMVKRVRLSLLVALAVLVARPGFAADARFDLVGPRIDVRVTRDGQTLPIASVPNLRPGDRLWIHPDLPATQSVKYLLICTFLRGTTNPPPENWFTRIDTWDKHVREEGVFITVPAEAEQALLFMAPETGGDFSTLRSAVQGRPGAFVRAQQDLTEAGFEQARIEKYLASIRRVPPGDATELQKHSDLLARTLALKPNAECFKRPADVQFNCLTQTGSQSVLDDGHGQSIVSALSNGPGSDFITQASYTQAFGAGVYSAYVGAIVDLVRILGNLHTAQYQYIPAISFPQAEAMNLRLNTPPSFHNPKSVLVIALPAVQTEVAPPLRPADINHVACLIEPSVTLPVEGAPLVFSTDFAHDLVLHLNTPPGAPAEPDIRLTADAYFGGLALEQTPEHHVPLRDPLDRNTTPTPPATPGATVKVQLGTAASPAKLPVTQPEPVMLTGTIRGRWGFDPFTGPTVPLQQLPGSGWHIVTAPSDAATSGLIAGHAAQLLLASTGTACVHTISARPFGRDADVPVSFKPEPPPRAGETPQPNLLALTLPLEHDQAPGDLRLSIQQYDQPRPDELATRTFAEPSQVTSITVHAGDRSLLLHGQRLDEVARLNLGDLTFTRPADAPAETSDNILRLSLSPTVPPPSTHNDDHLTARVTLVDGRVLSIPVIVSSPRPVITLLRKSAEPLLGTNIALPNPDDLPLTSRLTFTLKSPQPFPRTGQVEIETLDGTLRTVLTLAPSGGLLLQDPHTVVATLDPLRSFGPSAFGPLHLRAVFPAPKHHDAHGDKPEAAPTEEAGPASDWLPLATLVRLPSLSQLQCSADPTQPCTLTGNNLFLIEAVSADPAFTDPVPVPDGYTGAALTLPHVSAGTVFLKLRDDPSAVDTANLPAPTQLAPHIHATHTKPIQVDTQPPATQQSPASTPGSSATSTPVPPSL